MNLKSKAEIDHMGKNVKRVNYSNEISNLFYSEIMIIKAIYNFIQA